jgi:adenylosuccinate synthase
VEASLGEKRIGTTSRGIGPAYEDKIARRGIRVGDLGNVDALADAVRHNVDARNRIIGESHMEAAQVLDDLRAAWSRMAPWVQDVSLFLARARAAGEPIMFEGAQGTLLDIDHGTYPYVTSSNATIGGVCTGLGVPPKAIDGVIGVAKAYTTRVGEGPLPTELHGELGDRLRESGQEFGAVTGRPRRCGWFDAVAVRYAVRVNGLDGLAVTKLDVLDGMETLQICTAYTCGGVTLTEFPSEIAQLAACEPVYESLPGWREPTKGARRFSDLPERAQAYLARLEALSGVPATIVSTGSAREDTIVRPGSIAGQWGLHAVAG